MFFEVKINKNQRYSALTDISLTAPNTETVLDATGLLIYNRLPANTSAETIASSLKAGNCHFYWQTEFNFSAALIQLDDGRPVITSIFDRFGSYRIYHVESETEYKIATDWRAVVSDPLKWDENGLTDIVSGRVLYDNHCLFENARSTPINHYSKFDQSLVFHPIPLPAKKVTVPSKEQLLDSIESSLLDTLKKGASESDSCAVLLSGGVDSFILAALSSKAYKKVVAYTPTWEEDFNPELERAKVFAAKLGIEHKVITITQAEIAESYHELLGLMGVPIRNFSSVALFALFKHIDESHVLYGEFADTLFGSGAIKGRILDIKYHTALKPFTVIPKVKKVVQSLARSHNLYSIVALAGINEKHWQHAGKIHGFSLSAPYLPGSTEVNSWKAMNLATSCRQHMVEIEMAGISAGKTVITPFYNAELIRLSDSLNDVHLYGERGLSLRKNFKQNYSMDVKILLKELACRFISRDSIYKPKLGFPTPHVKWIVNLFGDDLKRMAEKNIIDDTTENYVEREYEWVWTQMNLFHIDEKHTN